MKTFEFDKIFVIDGKETRRYRFCFTETPATESNPVAPLWVYSYDAKAWVEIETLSEEIQNEAWNFASSMYYSYCLDQFEEGRF